MSDTEVVVSAEGLGGWSSLPGPDPPVRYTAVALVPDSSPVAVGTADGRVLIFDRSTASLLNPIEVGGQATQVSWSPDGRFIAGADVAGQGGVWAASSGTPAWTDD
jgi:WD40 repeat protein